MGIMSAKKNNLKTTIYRNGNADRIMTRPNASPGFWLCSLIPLSYMVNNYSHPKSSATFEYRMTTIISFGLFLQSAYIFLCICRASRRIIHASFLGMAGLCTTLLIFMCLEQQLIVSVFWGFSTTALYSIAYKKLLRALPKSFTYGEASIVAQGFVLFLLNAVIQIPNFIRDPPQTDISEMNAIMVTALLCLIVVLGLIYAHDFLRKPILFYILLMALVVAVCVLPVTSNLPVVTLWTFIITDLRRVCVIVFYFGIVGLTIGTINWRLRKSEKASTSDRKIFHLLIVFVYIPGLVYQCTLLYIATGVALAFLSVFETFRLTKVPPFGEILDKSFDLFSDAKDAGFVALTPFYLLVGCSLPLWISPYACVISDSTCPNLVPMMAGVLSIGVGDTAASVVGSALGKHKWPKTSKSIEGTVANIALQLLTISGLGYLGYVTLATYKLIVVGAAISVSAVVEAFTDQVDNLVLPLIFYILCVAL